MVSPVRSFQKENVPLPKWNGRFEISENTPLDLEIGCGVGMHPIQYCLKNPDRHLIALEHTSEKFGKLQRRILNHPPLPNLHAFHENAISWVSHLLSPSCLDRIFILYPNPNPKNKSKRWHAMPFMAKLIECLRPDGQIVLATNEKVYYSEAIDYLQNNWSLRLQTSIIAPDSAPRSHFERKYLGQGQTCYQILATKEVKNASLA